MKRFVLSIVMLIGVAMSINAQTCKTPQNISVNGLSTSSATILWDLSTDGDVPTSYLFRVSTTGGTTVFVDSNLVVSTQSQTVTGLTANTTYIVEIGSTCNATGSGTSEIVAYSFTTPCSAQAAPYTENFDAAAPSCTFSGNATWSNGGRTGKCMALTTTPSQPAYFVFPELTLQSNNIETSVWLKSSSVIGGNVPVYIGIVTDPSDIEGSFEMLYSGTLNTTTWTEIRMNTSATVMPATSSTMMAVVIPQGLNRIVYIDDAAIHAIPTCVRPEDFAISNIGASSATFSWTTTNATSVKIYITATDDTRTITANTNPYTITDLVPNTDYSFQIRGICSATDSSEMNPNTLTAHTECVAADSALFTQTFESLTVPNSIPDCWKEGWFEKPAANTKVFPFAATTDRSHSGSRSMALLQQTDGSVAYLSSQALPIEQSGKYTLSAWVYRQEASGAPLEGLKFWVSDNQNDTTGATLLGYIPRHYLAAPVEHTPNTWYNYEFIINTTGTKYIIIEGISQNAAPVCFDDVAVRLTPSCFKVSNITFGHPTHNSLGMTWTRGKNEQQWIISYSLNDGQMTTDTVSTPAYTIQGLSAATAYSIDGTIISLCGAGDMSDPVSFNTSIVTTCEPLSFLPYSCGFENEELTTTAAPLPLCWTRYNDATGSDNTHPQASTSSAYSHTGSGYLKFLPVTSSVDYGEHQVAILPQLNTTLYPVNTLRLVFYAQATTINPMPTVYVGVMSDPTDLSTFVQVDSFVIGSTDYLRYEAQFANYTGNGSYIAMMTRRVGTAFLSLNIDDVRLETTPTCPDLEGAGAIISDITDHSARITVSDLTTGTWSYAFGTAGTPLSACTTVDTVTGPSVILTNLTTQTSYVVYARRRCGTEFGSWSGAVTFRTACGAFNIPYSDGFESYTTGQLTGCYYTETDENYLNVFSDASSSAGTYNHTTSGSKGLSTSYDRTSSTPAPVTGEVSMAIYVHLEAGHNYEMSIYAKSSAYDNSYNLSFVSGTTNSNLVAISTVNVSGTAWTHHTSYFTPVATGNYYMGVRTSPTSPTGDYVPYLDDILIQEISCVPPTDALVSNLGSTTATIGFSSLGSMWEVAVSSTPINGTVTGNVYHDTITTNSFTVSGLAVNSTYYYTVRTICGNNDASVWMTPRSFHTRCTSVNVPYFEGFETSSAVSCWQPLNGEGTISRETSRRNTGASSMRATAVSAVSPEFNITSFSPYMLSGWAYSPTDSAVITIGVMTDPDDISTFQELSTATITPANTWVEFASYFTLLEDPEYSEFFNARYIVLATVNNTIYFDDINIDEAPTCNRPTQGIVSNVTGRSVTIDWTENGSATSWLVSATNSFGVVNSQVTNSHPYTLTGLNPSTTYTLHVRAICSASDTSMAYKVGSITTACDFVTAPYTETFESFAVPSIPTCWDNSLSTHTRTYDNYNDYLWGVYSAANNKSIRLYNAMSNSGDAAIVTPEIIIPAGRNFELCYDYCHQASSGNMLVKIKRRSSQNFTTIATHASNGLTNNTAPSAFLNASYGLQAYAGDTIQVQFYNYVNFGSGAIWVDNVKVRELSECSELRTLTVQEATSNSITLAFADTSTTHTSWQYAIVQYGHDVTEATPVDITTKLFTINGLTPSTTYDIYVRATCSPTDHSSWSNVTQKTLALPATLPYITDFSNPSQNSDWNAVGNGSNYFVFGNDVNALFATGSHALYVSNGTSYTYNINSQSITGIGRLFSFGETNYSIEFDWKCPGGENRSDFARIYLAPAASDLLPTYSSAFTFVNFVWPDNIIALDGVETDPISNVDGGVQHQSIIVDMTGRAGDYYLVFVWVNDATLGTANYPLSVGNLSVSELTCEPIVNLAVDENSISYNSATATFNNPNPGSDIRWAVSTSTLITDTIASGLTQGETVTATGLNASTMYYLFVRAECTALDRSPWVSVPFITACAPITTFPYFESFESLTFPPVCWTNTSLSSVTSSFGTEYGTWEQSTRNTHSGTKSATIAPVNGTSALLATPAVAFEATREYHVSFWLMQSGSSWNDDELDLYVGPDATTTDGATLLAHYVIYNSNRSGNSLVKFDVDLPSGLDGNYYILFKGTDVSNAYIYLDDVTIDIYPPCRNLTTLPTVVASTSTTASLTIPVGIRTSIKYGIAPYSSNPQPSSIFATQTTTTGDVTFTGLTPGNSYSVFARGYCSDGDSTSWTAGVTVTTKTDDCFAPENLHVDGNVSNVAATIAWNNVPDVTTYECIMNGDTSYVTTPQAAYTSLTPNTDYTFTVRGFCGTNDTTAWSTLAIHTLTTPATIPYTTGFEASDDNNAWIKHSSGYASNFIIGYDAEAHCSGARGLYISSDGRSYSQSVPTNPTPRYGVNLYGVTYYTRTIYFPGAGNYEVSFDWKCDPEGESTYEAYGRAFVAPANSYLPVDDDEYLRNLPEGAYALGNNMNNSSTWQRTSAIFTLSEPQYMDLVFMWIGISINGYSSNDGITDTPLAIDNVEVNEVACLPVNSIASLSITDTTASVMVTQPEPVAIEYALLTTYSVDSIHSVTTIDNTPLKDTISLSGLTASTTYYLFVRQSCNDSTHSSWRVLSFQTTATPAPLPYICGFEDDEENANWFYTQAQTNGFTIGTATSFGGTHSLYVSNDGSSYNYDNTALSFAYAHRIMSLPAGLYEYSFDWQCNGENRDDGARMFLIPADVLLFANSWLYGLSYTSVPKNAIALDNGFMYGRTSYTSQSGSFTITEDKLYNLVVAWRSGTSLGSNPPISIDNIFIRKITCLPPTVSLISSSLAENSASFAVTNVNENSTLVYAVSTTGDVADALLYDTLPYSAQDTIALTGLSASSTYYIHVRSLCSADDESFWTSVQFKTLCGVISLYPYTEDFENINASNGYVANAASAMCWSAINAVSAKPYYNITSTQHQSGANSLRLTSSSTAPLYMLLPEMDDLNNLYLSFRSMFDKNVAAAGTLSIGYLTDETDASTFVSLQSITRSTAWTAQSAIFTNIPVGSRMAICYSGATSNTYNAYIDNVRVSRLVDGPVYYDTVCNSAHYMLHGFTVRNTNLTIGDNTLTRIQQSTTEGSADTLVTAHVHRLADIVSTTSDTTCGGQPYTRGLWNIQSPVTRLYRQTFRGASACGCDSTVELNLTVIQTTSVIIDTICSGGSYTFRDTTITTPGKYLRSYTNTYGCQCTDTLYLMVMPDTVFDIASVCQNNLPYTWHGQNITTAGIHTTTFVGLHGCSQTGVLDLTIIPTDSIVSLNICQGGSAQVADTFITTAGNYVVSRIDLKGGCTITYYITATVTPAVPVDVYDYTCEGYPYSGHGIKGLTVTSDTVVMVTSRTIDAKCDSLTNVHIHFEPTVANEIHETIKKGEIYHFDGNDLTESGVYTATFHTAKTNCDSVVTLYLTVTTAVDHISDIRIDIVPNPVEAGATAYIYGELDNVVSVEIINSLGQVVDSFVPSSYPIEISNITVSGLYNVRIITSDGNTHIKKLIIK